MSRLTGSDALGLFEAYQAVYNPQQYTEDQLWEEVEYWVDNLMREGYDLSDYTWEEMYESYNYYNTIVCYLLGEGYADTNENALIIMANMSEEWKQSIVEGVGGYNDPVMGPNAPIGKAVRSGLNTAKNVATNVKSAVVNKAKEVTSGRYGPPGSNY